MFTSWFKNIGCELVYLKPSPHKCGLCFLLYQLWHISWKEGKTWVMDLVKVKKRVTLNFGINPPSFVDLIIYLKTSLVFFSFSFFLLHTFDNIWKTISEQVQSSHYTQYFVYFYPRSPDVEPWVKWTYILLLLLFLLLHTYNFWVQRQLLWTVCEVGGGGGWGCLGRLRYCTVDHGSCADNVINLMIIWGWK